MAAHEQDTDNPKAPADILREGLSQLRAAGLPEGFSEIPTRRSRRKIRPVRKEHPGLRPPESLAPERMGVMTKDEILQEISDMGRGIKPADRNRINALKTLLETYKHGPIYHDQTPGSKSDERKKEPDSIDDFLRE